MKKHLLLCLLLIFSIALIAENFYFSQTSLSEGLSQSTVRTIYRDKTGLLWIGTRDGLNRFDGEKIKTYYHQSDDETSIPNNEIFYITDDPKGNLWICSEGGLCRYDRSSDSFLKEKIDDREVLTKSALAVDDVVYFFGSDALFVFYPEQNRWERKPYRGDEKVLTLAVTAKKWTDNSILIGSRWKGLFECDIRTGKLTRMGDFKNVLDVFVDSRGWLWVSEFEKGVFVFDKNFRQLLDLSPAVSSMKTEKVMNITEYEGEIWLSTDGNGVYIYSPETASSRHLISETTNPFSLPVNSLLTTYIDPYNNLWLGTVRGGLLLAKKTFFQSFSDAPKNSVSGLSAKTVLSIFEDQNGKIWIGTDGEGINSFDPGTNRFNHYPATYGKKISGITQFSSGKLLVSIYNEGLMLFDTNSKTLTPFELMGTDGNPISLNSLIGYSVRKMPDGNIYISDENLYAFSQKTNNAEIVINYDKKNGAIRLFNPKYHPNLLLIFNNLVVKSLDVNTQKLQTIYEFPEANNLLINAVDLDELGNYWIGTTKGLFLRDAKSAKITQIAGSQINSVSTLIADNNGSLWIGEGVKLMRYRLKEKDILHYAKNDGVQPNEYLAKPRLLTSAGDVYLGGVFGFVRIDRDVPAADDELISVELLDIQLDGSMYPPKKNKEKERRTAYQNSLEKFVTELELIAKHQGFK